MKQLQMPATTAAFLLPATHWGTIANFIAKRQTIVFSAIAAATPVVFDQSRRVANEIFNEYRL